MGHKVPGWVVLALVVASWCAGRLADAAGAPLGVVALVAATLSLGGFVVAAWKWPGPKVPATSPDDGLAARAIGGGLPIASWFLASFFVYAGAETLLPWTNPPMVEALRGDELLAGMSALAVAGLGGQVAESVMDRRHSRGRQRLRREVEEGATAREPVGSDVVFGWRWKGVGLMVLGPAFIVALGTWAVLVTADLATQLLGIGMLAFGAALAFGILFSAVTRPRLLVLGPDGIDVAERGMIPWHAVRSCTLERGGGVELLTVRVHAGAEFAMPRRLRWQLQRADPRTGVATVSLDATPAQLGAAFASCGQRLLVD